MHVGDVDTSESAAAPAPPRLHAIAGNDAAAVARNLDGLLQALLDALVARVKVVGAALLECELELEGGVVGGDAAALDGLHESGPDVGADPGGHNVRVVCVEDWSCEALQARRGGGRKVDDAAVG